ncbi:MAG: hypothetical protein WBV83_06435, partial [Bradyrhizobium sp.]|uniref:hypothetical protein n=1 Tax=Bradyrhizobium sp. TaxID=376 RepID=UPI003C588D85
QGCGRSARPAFPAPFVGARFLQDSGETRRGIAEVCPRLSWLFEILNRRFDSGNQAHVVPDK